MTIQEFYTELEKFDWFFMMSDDQRVYLAGSSNFRKLETLTIDKPEWKALLKEYKEYVWSKVNGKVMQKPERPAE